jgi:hypothetical protein
MTPTLTPIAFPDTQGKQYIFKGVYLDHRNEKNEQVVFVRVFKISEGFLSFSTLDYPGFLYHDTRIRDKPMAEVQPRFFEGTWYVIE